MARASGGRHGESPAAAIGAYWRRCSTDMAQMMPRPETEAWSRFIIREQQFPTEAFDLLFAKAMRRCPCLYRADRQRPPRSSRREAVALAILMFGQAMVLRARPCRRAARCRSIISTRILPIVRARLRANVLCILSEKPQ